MNSEILPLTGIESIDSDHRGLLETLRRLQTERCSQDELVHTWCQLRQYADEHFAREEQILLAYAYPQLEYHKKMHGVFRDKIDALGDTLLEGKDRPDNEMDRTIRVAKEELGKPLLAPASPRVMMVAFLVQWLLQHINGHDREYVGHLKKIVPTLNIP